jgi:hypothetical protein
LGLQAQAGPFIYAWIHQKGAQTLRTKQHQPYTSAIIKYGAKKQNATPQSTSC